MVQIPQWVAWLMVGWLVLDNVRGWFVDDGDDDAEVVDEEKESEDRDFANIIFDLRTQVAEQAEDIRQYRHEIAMMEREGVIAGLWELEECGYWKPAGEELQAFREEHPDCVPEDYEAEDIRGDERMV